MNEDLRSFRAWSDSTILDVSADDFTPDALRKLVRMPDFQDCHIKEVLAKYGSPGITGMMGAYSQEALYRARIHPKRKVPGLSDEDIISLHRAMKDVTSEAIAAGGRASERDLFDQPGGFVPSVSKATEGKPCSVCGTPVTAIKMGGAGWYYICPGCQALPGN